MSMDAKLFGQVALRVLAVYVFALGLMALPNLYQVLHDHVVPEEPRLDYRLFATALTLPLVIGLLIWVSAPLLSRWMVSGAKESSLAEPLGVNHLQTVALTTLGLILAYHGVSSLVIYVAEGALDSAGFSTILLGYVIQLSLGIALILGGKFFTRWFKRLRDFGQLPDK